MYTTRVDQIERRYRASMSASPSCRGEYVIVRPAVLSRTRGEPADSIMVDRADARSACLVSGDVAPSITPIAASCVLPNLPWRKLKLAYARIVHVELTLLAKH